MRGRLAKLYPTGGRLVPQDSRMRLGLQRRIRWLGICVRMASRLKQPARALMQTRPIQERVDHFQQRAVERGFTSSQTPHVAEQVEDHHAAPASSIMQQPSITTFAVENGVSDAIDRRSRHPGVSATAPKSSVEHSRVCRAPNGVPTASSSATSSSAMTCELSFSSSSTSSPSGVSWKSSPSASTRPSARRRLFSRFANVAQIERRTDRRGAAQVERHFVERQAAVGRRDDVDAAALAGERDVAAFAQDEVVIVFQFERGEAGEPEPCRRPSRRPGRCRKSPRQDRCRSARAPGRSSRLPGSGRGRSFDFGDFFRREDAARLGFEIDCPLPPSLRSRPTGSAGSSARSSPGAAERMSEPGGHLQIVVVFRSSDRSRSRPGPARPCR